MPFYNGSVVAYVYDIRPVIRLIESNVVLPQHRYGFSFDYFLDSFLKYTIQSFEVVTVEGYREREFPPEMLSQFEALEDARHLMWSQLIFRPEHSGKHVFVTHAHGQLYLFIPGDAHAILIGD